MTVSITRGTNDKPVASEMLGKAFRDITEITGCLFIGYPIIGTPEGRHPIDALLVSPEKGVIIFDLIESADLGPYSSRQDDSANKLEARLKTHSELMQKRDLIVPINTVSFAPSIRSLDQFAEDGYQLVNSVSLNEALTRFEWRNRREGAFEATVSAIQSISTIRKNTTKRTIGQENSRGAKLKRLESSIAMLDNLQSKAVIETVEGVQRIRGLAGSGKTIVLALKAAYLHAQHPEWRIAVTFNTRSLKGQFRRLINNFSLEQTGEEPDWNKLRILSAWGASGGGERDGIYHEFCREHEIEYFDFRAARNQFGQGDEFAGVCQLAISRVSKPRGCYDAILVDEAQDFPPAFLRLCYELLDEHKRLVYAYDELQNLAGESLPSPEEIFGRSPDGSPKVRFEHASADQHRRDIILGKCYRNSRPVLGTAHALGFGIYREPLKTDSTRLVQMFAHPQLWAEIGYKVLDGELRDGMEVTLHRTEETSPRFLEDHSAVEDLIEFRCFESEDDQTQWVVNSIKENLEADELRHDDIMVINTNPLTTRVKVGAIRRRLFEFGVASHLAGVDTDADVFFQPEHASVTFTGIYRAKGNEAGMVYIVNAQDCHSSAWNLASIRNRLFTAITRSKAWVRVTGFGDGMKELMREFEELKRRNFVLHFTYPTEQQRKQLRIVHRDVTDEERKHLGSREESLKALLKDLEVGTVHLEDFDDVIVAKLQEIFMKKGRTQS